MDKAEQQQTQSVASPANATSSGQHGPGTWAAVLGRTLAPGLNKNVLEVVLEKDARGSFTVGEIECVNLIRRLGLDSRPEVHVEGGLEVNSWGWW